MAKLQSIINLLQDTTLGLTFTRENWLSFLSTASMNYKYPFQDQVLIYAQRPQATACASIDFWNKSYKRWVKKNSKGIALIDDSREDLKLKYVFDAADTHHYYDDRFKLWQLKEEHEAEVSESLINSFGEITKGDFVSNISQTAENLTVDNEVDYLLALVEAKEDSALENIEEISIQDELHETIKTSVEFMLLNRAGRVSEDYKNKLQFPYLNHFNTLDTISTLGTAVSEIAQMGIRDMERTVKAIEREKRKTIHFFAKKEEIRDNSLRENSERRDNDGSDLSKERGLSVAGADHRAEPREDRQVWFNEEGIFKEGEASPIQSALDKGRTDESSVSGTSSSGGRIGEIRGDIQSSRGIERGNEEQSAIGLDEPEKQNQEASGRTDFSENNISLRTSGDEQNSSPLFNAAEELPILKSVQEQLSLFTAEDLSNPVTNGITTPAILKLNFSQNVKDEVLTVGSQSKDSRYRICAYFRSGRSKAENIRFLKKEFKEDYRGFQVKGEKITAHYAADGIRLARGKSVNYASETMLIPWAEAEARIRELIVLGKFMPEEELDKVGQWELNDTAVKVLNIYRDEFANIPNEEKFFVPSGTYPDSLEQIKELLKDKDGVKSFYDNIAHLWELIDKYPPRYRIFHDIPEAREQLDNLQRSGITLAADKNFAFYKHECFISDDEIDKLFIDRGSGVESGKYRIYEYFNEHLAEKERIDFLKKEYGIGGSADGYNREDHDSKGISYARGGSNAPYDKVLLSWAKVAKTIDRLIRDGRYLSKDELAQIESQREQGIVIEATKAEETSETAELVAEIAETAEAEEKEITIPIGAEVTIDERKFVVESVNYDFNSVSLRDITFESNTGYPIFRNEKIGLVYSYLKKQEQTAVKSAVIPKINYQITADELNIGTPKEKFRRNIEAIRLLKKLEQENRLANANEQEILARYAGWGGLSEAFDENKASWHSEYLELKDLLSEEEYKAARESTLTAFYTPPIVIKAMYQGLANLGFTEGNILEPSCGVGSFLGLLPEEMQKSRLYGVELDTISGSIAQMLYQKEQIQIKGFEKTDFSDNFFDAAIGNIPFGQFKVLDKRYDKENFLIHDFFFAKALDKVRPGGVVAFITSKGTLDKENTKVRKYLAQRADLLGAIRLPNNTFSKNAGTEVTSDIIFLQKRERFITEPEVNWLSLGEKEGLRINQYFIDNPNMVLGELKEISGPFGKETACVARDGDNLEELLAQAIKNIQGEIPAFEYEEELEAEEEFILADESIHNFSYGIFEGKLYYRQNSRMYPINLSLTGENRVRRMIEIRDCLRNLIDYQLNDYSDEVIENEQAKLNSLYDAFTQEYGIINSRANALAFRDDDSYYLLCSLEILDNEGNFKAKADMFTKRTIRAQKAKDKAETSAEALAISIAEKAKVDLPFMEKLTGKSEEEIYNDLEGVIFLNPLYDEHNQALEKYLPADEYLSGNVREKLRIAKIKAETDERFAVNVTSLTQVQPTDLTAGEISVRLGANWLKEEYIEDFVYELLETPRYLRHYIKAHYSAYTGEWRIEGKTRDSGNIKAINTYGTRRINGYEIIEDSLNLKDVRVMDYFLDEDGKRIATLNKKETAIALSKQELIKEKFSEWIFSEQKRREDICKTYNELFNSNRPREYDGSHITFSGMNPEISLRPHQINAAARILYGGNTLLAHTVGAGKTFTMTAAAMESKRLGLCQKSIFVVPNHLTEQWAGEFLQLYPSAKILVTTKKDFETKNRKKFCARIATGDYDAVIIGQSQFEKIPVSIERQQRIIERQIEDIIFGIAEAKNSRAENFTIKQMEKTKKNLEIKLAKLNDQSRKDDVITFEELGIDRMFVDESHFYKNRAKRCRIRVV